MMDNYTPQVGDRVRRASWLDDTYIDVKYVGQRVVVGDDEDGLEVVALIEFDGPWEIKP